MPIANRTMSATGPIRKRTETSVVAARTRNARPPSCGCGHAVMSVATNKLSVSHGFGGNRRVTGRRPPLTSGTRSVEGARIRRGVDGERGVGDRLVKAHARRLGMASHPVAHVLRKQEHHAGLRVNADLQPMVRPI